MTVKLNEGQTKAIDTILDFLIDPMQSEMAITGGPGTGKSTLVGELIKQIENQKIMIGLAMCGKDTPIGLALTATTGQAADSLRIASGIDAETVHSFLSLRMVDDYTTGELKTLPKKEYRLIHNQIVVVDEAGGVTKELIYWIRKTLVNCKVIYVGDADQLLGVGESSSVVFDSDMLTCELTKNERFNKEIGQVVNKYRTAVRTGIFPNIVADGQHIIHANGREFESYTNALCTGKGKGKILAWRNNRVLEYANHINLVSSGNEGFIKGMKVIVNSNVKSGCTSIPSDTEVTISSIVKGEEENIKGSHMLFNKEVWAFVPDNLKDKKRTLKSVWNRGEKEKYFEIKNKWVGVRSAKASTVHKAQGSTCDIVLVDLSDIGCCEDTNTVARLLYVAISRAAKKVILYGSLPEKYGTILT